MFLLVVLVTCQRKTYRKVNIETDCPNCWFDYNYIKNTLEVSQGMRTWSIYYDLPRYKRNGWCFVRAELCHYSYIHCYRTYSRFCVSMQLLQFTVCVKYSQSNIMK